MSLNTSNLPLENRLESIAYEDKATLVDELEASLSRRKINGSYYYREKIISIISYFTRRNVPFGKPDSNPQGYLHNNFNKEPIKPIEWGMLLCDLPTGFMECLDDPENLYFFAGVSAVRNKMDRARVRNIKDPKSTVSQSRQGVLEILSDLDFMTPYEISSVYIREGIDYMAAMHNSIVRSNTKIRNVRRGSRRITYKNRWTPPYSGRIRKELIRLDDIKENIRERKNLIAEYGNFFSLYDQATTETERYSLSEKIGKGLDSLKPDELAMVKGYWGSEKIGDF